ncbi:MAG: hypothetical protein HUJ31_07210 [Pseudomonadales bacterium]|nr:hypothetical protein [Pseudomonadales bacterium]
MMPTAMAAEPVKNWLDIVRGTPYWASQGVAQNLQTIRRWVLLGRSYCETPQRHILFDHRGRFVGYIDNGDTTETTIERLNETRRRLTAEEPVDNWSPGSGTSQGYPFALACDQPFVDMNDAIARMVGSEDEYKLWGTWDDMRVGTEENQVSLVELIRTVYEHRRQQGRFTFPDEIMPLFLGKTLIESGGRKHALSTESARGIMQLRPDVLDDCQIPEDLHLHRMAQVDCALRLIEQNHRNLAPPFREIFGELPEPKQDLLYSLLLIQAYQIGVGRTTELLLDEELGKAARYFATHAERFSAEDIQTGMVYHNIGRRDIGLLTLYYVTDIRIVTEALCQSSAMERDRWCDN